MCNMHPYERIAYLIERIGSKAVGCRDFTRVLEIAQLKEEDMPNI